MDGQHITETLEATLTQKVERQAVLNGFFVRLCEKRCTERDPERFNKISGDRQRLSTELGELNDEIVALCKVLNAHAIAAAR